MSAINVRMRLRGSSSWTPLTAAARLVGWLRVQRATDDGAQHRQHTVPDAGPTLVLRTGPECNRRLRGMDVLPPAGVEEAKLHGRGGDAVGGAIACELGQELVVLGGEAGLFLLQRRDLVARLGGGCGLPHQQQSRRAQRSRAPE